MNSIDEKLGLDLDELRAAISEEYSAGASTSVPPIRRMKPNGWWLWPL